MYAINRNGDKLPVDDSKVDYSKLRYDPYFQTVALLHDDVYLKPIWILQLQRDPNIFGKKKSEPLAFEIVAELKYNHDPTEEEILYAMASYDIGFHQIATVVKGYEMDAHYED